MPRIIQIESQWRPNSNDPKPMLLGLDDNGDVWFWDWFAKKWDALRNVDNPVSVRNSGSDES